MDAESEEVTVSPSPVVEASVGTIEGAWAGSMMTVLVDVAVRPDWSPACAGRVATWSMMSVAEQRLQPAGSG